MRSEPLVYIIILNWNGWRDTIECLESVFRLTYPAFRVIVCDNASADESTEHIKQWAKGQKFVEPNNTELAYLVTPPVPKPIKCGEVVSAGRAKADGESRDSALTIIHTGGNLGFAGGNNVGIRHALEQRDCEFIWLLNNDTVVEADALSALVQRMQQRPDAGICGSTLLYYNDPDIVQAFGGSAFNRWTARGQHIGLGENRNPLPRCEDVEPRMKYVVGASMLVSKRFLDDVGVMNENYFLYFEEIDWATRAVGRFSLAYAPRSIVYHKEGASTGQSPRAFRQNPMADRFIIRNRLKFTQTYYPHLTLAVAALIVGSACWDFVRGRGSSCKLKVSAAVAALPFS